MPDKEIIETSNQTSTATSDSANEKQEEARTNVDASDLQIETELKSGNAEEADNLSVDESFAANSNKTETAEERYAALNDSHLRLMADFDNFRKRTLREKAELIKSGGANVLTNLLPVVDDFERALITLPDTEELLGVKLIYDKFIAFLTQQGVKAIDAAGQPFDTEMAEAVAMLPVEEEDKKGKVIYCVQTGYTLYDKVIRHARVVVGE
ncbi:MAG: nucleotide exchange factor GrpE [Tannerella sp.]|jgi:molecular chaperone GrpE|nr:nucleotide exchange factor GrpE [Tannerella sp.]